MKKLLFVLAIGAFVASCNDSSSETESTADTTVTEAPAPATVDTMSAPVDTTAAAPVDTTTAK